MAGLSVVFLAMKDTRQLMKFFRVWDSQALRSVFLENFLVARSKESLSPELSCIDLACCSLTSQLDPSTRSPQVIFVITLGIMRAWVEQCFLRLTICKTWRE